MYDELKEKCRACSQGCIYPSECSYFDKPPLRCMRQLLSEAADAIEELSAFKAQITDGHFYCMKDGVLYAAKYETPKAKSIQLPPIEFAEEGE